MGDLQLIMADVERSYRTGTPIYDGTARTIAAIFSGGGPFEVFATTGAIMEEMTWGLSEEIDYVNAHPESFGAHRRIADVGTTRQNVAMLRKLEEYIKLRGVRGPVDGWAHIWASELNADDEYNGTEDD